MHKGNNHHIPITLEGLHQKLDFEIKRLIREREDGIASYVGKTALLGGISKLVFRKRNGVKITLSYRIDDSGILRFAREKQFTSPLSNQRQTNRLPIGRMSEDIKP